jgi:hypothetical protein
MNMRLAMELQASNGFMMLRDIRVTLNNLCMCRIEVWNREFGGD